MKQNPYSDMDESAYRIAYLIAGYIRQTLSEKEHDELDDWVNESDHNMQLFEELTDEKNLEANLAWMDGVQTEQSFKTRHEKPVVLMTVNKNSSRSKWIAAASVVLLASIFFIYRYTTNITNGTDTISAADTTQLKPGGNKATLTLADGTVIDLNTANNGTLQIGEDSHVNKPADGELVYEPDESKNESPVIHTLSTPMGGQYQVTLPDGTKVWLNAATVLRYPSHFSGKERQVELNGEAYFEVSKNTTQPFRIQLTDSSDVLVTGTQFNVMAYSNEPTKEVSLIEGGVTVSKQNSKLQLEPGTQAIIKNGIDKKSSFDSEEIIGWKNGLFVFHDASIETIMKQVERWYDAKVVYQVDIKQQFNASILRREPLSKLLRLLELTGYVHFKIENKTIYVLP